MKEQIGIEGKEDSADRCLVPVAIGRISSDLRSKSPPHCLAKLGDHDDEVTIDPQTLTVMVRQLDGSTWDAKFLFHRTAPHCTAPHRTALHRTSP